MTAERRLPTPLCIPQASCYEQPEISRATRNDVIFDHAYIERTPPYYLDGRDCLQYTLSPAIGVLVLRARPKESCKTLITL